MENLSPFEFFEKEISHEDVVVRTEAMLKMILIASLMEPGDTRDKMVPVLRSKCNAEKPEHDQVLMAMAKQLGGLLPFMGGAEYAGLLLPILKELLVKEETYVRDPAARSCSTILRSMGADHLAQLDEYRDMFRGLMPTEESGDVFYPKASAVLLTPALLAAYSVHDEEAAAKNEAGESVIVASKREIREIYYKLQTDENIIVRITATKVFMEVIDVVDPEIFTSEILVALRTFLGDDASCIRETVITFLPQINRKLSELEMRPLMNSEILPCLKELADHASWRIRQALVRDFSKYVDTYDAEVVQDELFPIIIKLLQDHEPEVRQLVLPEMYAYLDKVSIAVFMRAFAPLALVMVEDPIPQVRKLLAELSIEVASRQCDNASMHDIIEKLLQDEEPTVRLRVLNKIETVARDIPDLASRLVGLLKDMFTAQAWRVRQRMLLSAVALVTHLGKDHFVENYLDECLGMLRDSVDEVRQTAAEVVPKLVPLMGVDFSFERIFPSVRTMSNADYLLRLSMLSALKGLLMADLPAGEAFQSECLALAVAATNDQVPNVRIRACQVLSSACSMMEAEVIRTHVRPVLDDLQGDKDRDVAHFALEGIKLCGT